jgi:hypothetical protein
MTQAAQARPPQSSARARRRPAWAGPLVVGLCFGLAYGITQRIVTLNVGELIRFGQGFDVQVFPGTTLESLRLRFGAAELELRGNLELNELERQKAADQGPSEKPEVDAKPDPVEAETSPARDDAAAVEAEPAREPAPKPAPAQVSPPAASTAAPTPPPPASSGPATPPPLPGASRP